MRVEGAGGGGVVREDVEVCVVLLQDNPAEGLFVCGAKTALVVSAGEQIGGTVSGVLSVGIDTRDAIVPDIFVGRCFDASFV